ncbi:MAG: YraN family protein [Minisyncoccia bacterium]|jgi:putative endonuclease
MKNKSEVGKSGEEIACGYLVQNQWEILERNYRRKADEIDIIAMSPDGTLVFCEVKSFATGEVYGEFNQFALTPEDNLTAAKFRKISRTCEFFARQHPELIDEEKGWRIDLIAIDISSNGKVSDVRHYENISP